MAWPIDDDDQGEVVAAHGAGHIVAAFALGGEVFEATIDPAAEGKVGGAHTFALPRRFGELKSYSDEDVQQIARFFQKTIAGPVAESWAVPGRDYDEALVRNTSDDRSDGATIIGWADRIHWGDRESADAWHDAQRAAIETHLQAHRPALDAIRDAPIARRTPTGAELHEVYDEASAGQDGTGGGATPA
jgi:hypothetical protein